MAKLLRTLRSQPVFWLLVAYFFAFSGHVLFRVATSGEATRETRGFYLQHVLRMSRPLLKDSRSRELTKYLHDAISTGLIDHFEYARKEKTERGGKLPPEHPVLAEPVSEINGWVWGRAEFSDDTLRIASGFGWRARLEAALGSARERLPADFLFLLFAGLLSTLFQHTARKTAVRQGAEGFGKRELKRAKHQRLEQAKLRAGESGDFTGVCGRTSLLNQAELADGTEHERFFERLEEFYSDCSALISRYRGKMLAVNGHELLYYFPEGDPTRQARLALASARDLHALASDRGFLLGTALASGKLHGGQLLSGFGLFGEPVEQTADCLQAIASGKESAIWVTDAFARTAGEHAEFRASLASGGRKLNAKVLVNQKHQSVALESCRAGDPSELAYHRGDSALAELLRSLSGEVPWERESFVAVVSELRSVTCRRCGSGVVEAYRALLSAELVRKDSYRLSAVLALAGQLLSRAQIDRPLEKLFLQAIALKDRRIRANGVELFTKFFPEREMPELRPLIRDEDNRVSSNALIKAACERFDEKVIARLEERVRGGSVAHVASALHAMGEIALYYRRHDPLFLGTKLSFLRLFDQVGSWASHPNTMIRRQALLAAHKLGSEPVNARLRELFTVCEDPELLGLFGSVYGWRREDRRAA